MKKINDMEKAVNTKFFILIILLLILGNSIFIFLLYKFSLFISEKLISEKYSPIYKVNLVGRGEKAVHSSYQKSKAPIRIAVAPVVSPEASLILYQDLVKYIGNAVGREGVLILRQTYLEINELLRNGRCDLAFVCSYAYIRGKKEFGMELFVVPIIKGKDTYHSYIIVPSTSSAKTFYDLRGKRFASADILSNSGWLFPAVWLKKHGEDPYHFFKEHIITGSHDKSIYSVAEGFVDAAAVDSVIYEQTPKEIVQKTKIILKSPPFGMPPVVVYPKLDKKLKQHLLNIMINMDKNPKGLKILNLLGIDRFIPADEKLFRTIEENVNFWEATSEIQK